MGEMTLLSFDFYSDFFVTAMSFRKQVEECGERIDHRVLHLSSLFLDFGKVICYHGM